MLQRVAAAVSRHSSELRSLVAPATQAWATSGISTSAMSAAVEDVQMDPRDMDGSLAKLMFEEAKAAKVEDALKKDVMEIIDWLEDATPTDENPKPVKMKDSLAKMGKKMQAEVFDDLLNSETMKAMSPPMRNMLSELAFFGQAPMLVPVVYRYVEMMDPKATTATKTSVELVVPSKESEAQLTEKKNMLIADMTAKNALAKDAQLVWNVVVDPSILGGCVFRMGDVEVDCSVKTLQDEFYASLDEAGIKRVE